MGYSQGGGAAHDLTEMLTTHYAEQQQDFVTMLTVYIDAIERQIFPLNDPIQQTDYPNNTFHLLNVFQRNDITFLGDFVDEDDPNIPFGVTIEQIPTHETAGWNNNLTHEQIDDDLQVKQRMRLRLEQRLIRR